VNQRLSAAAALLALLVPGTVLAQVLVIPRRAYRTPVHTYEFEWRHQDILVGPEAEGVAPPAAHRAHTQAPGTPGGAVPSAPTQQLRSPHMPLGEAGPPSLPASRSIDQDVGGTAVADADGGTPGPSDAGLPPPPSLSIRDEDAGTLLATGDGGTPDGGPTYATSLGTKSGGVRFFFYENEREVAELAAPQLENAYRYLVDRFRYVPTKTFPYILYSSYQEFLQTNITAVSEGTLGVTSTQGNLELTLPYMGDHRLFGEISTHELAHQFTIQKVRTLAEGANTFGDPLNAIPLWYIEGIAEYYAKGGLDPEAEMMVRDLLVNPDLEKGYAFLDFFSQGPYGFLWIYKVGQARATFLEETYGPGFLQKVLEESPKLISGTGTVPSLNFEGLLELLTGDDPKQISARFENWLKQRAYRTYLKAEQTEPALDVLRERRGIITALNSSPNGQVLLYRNILPETGENELILVDPRAPEQSEKVEGDGKPGYESFHPVFGRNFALSGEQLVFVAETLARDTVYVQDYKHSAEQFTAAELPSRSPYVATSRESPRGARYRVRFQLGKRVAYNVAQHGLIAVHSPAFSPDGKSLAFIGLNEKGVRDVYVLPLDQGPDAAPRQLTRDMYGERSLSWGPSGIVFTSDATAHGYYNLFRVRPETPEQVERLTTEARDHLDPVVFKDGRIFFVAYENSRSDLHEYTGGGTVVRRTDVATGLFEPCPGPEGNVWSLFHLSGERQPSLLRAQRMLSFPVAAAPADGTPSPLPQRPLTEAVPYRPFAWENIDIGPVMGFAGAGGGGFVGQVFAQASDRLKNHAMLLSVAVYGSLELTDGYLIYLDQSKRTTWGTGLFQSLRYRLDRSILDLAGDRGGTLPFDAQLSWERFYGAMGLARYPLSSFLFLEGQLSIGGVSYFMDPFTAFYLNLPEFNGIGDLYTPWRAQTSRARFQTEVSTSLGYNTLRYHYTGVPLSGTSTLLEVSLGAHPFDREVFGNVRLDAERYFPLHLGSTHVMLRGGTGTTFGGQYARSFYLSSFDTIRGVPFGDERWLLGPHYLYSTLELRVPLDPIIRVLILNNIMGVAGFDFGGVGTSPRDAWDHRVLNAAVGINVGFGPLLLRLHFAYPFDIGARAGRPDDGWVTQFSIGLAGLEGYFGKNGGERNSRPRVPPPDMGGFPAGPGGTL
jgi:hypothetical protein